MVGVGGWSGRLEWMVGVDGWIWWLEWVVGVDGWIGWLEWLVVVGGWSWWLDWVVEVVDSLDLLKNLVGMAGKRLIELAGWSSRREPEGHIWFGKKCSVRLHCVWRVQLGWMASDGFIILYSSISHDSMADKSKPLLATKQ